MFRKILLAGAALCVSAPSLAATQAIIVGNLFPDAATGPTGPAVILVEDGRIKNIAKGTNNPFQADRVVDLSSKTLVPGLIDLHVHLTGDPGDDFRDEAVNPDECAEKVRKSSKAGADVIKITATGGVLSQQGRGLEAHFTNEEMVSIANTAHSLGLKVMAHAHGARGIEAAAAAGIDSIEHGTFADEAALKVMRAKGTALVPTLMALEGVRARLGKGIYTPTVEVKAKQALEFAGRQVKLAKAMGVTVAFGTDAGVFEHGSNASEFALLVNAGMTPTEALASATTVAAKTLGLENEIGRIAVGYSADMVAVNENPLTNIRTLEKAEWVMVRGRIVP